ncbi:uncharacterized protein A1O9_04783 [Exophiala aquamarina CBS 119918]|uniref:Zn(2)-C6 fungal-type domain-containing protein n=1 Tax=Exophiala aquamarina CBS 119918 TaxID=1182545 RepID=A0A072PWH2_9EURO|nr:uncharacterized protein A1O9_04783 [Exophiala aquamarina CBS 119918]KEF59935.1 hypothetical protein A1O9_04783 [Exophiala aquamarina CBS 119918]
MSRQDCSTCVRRRIRCDRSLPKCHKCSKKSLLCPGYGPRLRWANGIAVRGHLKGCKTPNIDKPRRSSSATTSSSKTPTSLTRTKSNDSNTTLAQPVLTLDCLENLVPDLPDEDTIYRLLEHYDKNIAGLMVWIDSEQNEYRRLVLPLAQRQPVLLLAILAVSSQHLAVTQNEESNFSGHARDAAVSMISGQIRQVTGRLAAGHDLGSEIDAETAEWMLASMLTLASYEMAESEAGGNAADSHRAAARTLVNALATTNRQNNRLFQFLRNQLSIYDILACTTSFDPTSTHDIILPEVNPATIIFSDFLYLLHDVTATSRQDSGAQSSGGRMSSPKAARSLFGLARGSTLMLAGSLGLPNNERRRDFIRLVDIYHHAGLLYTYRLLFKNVVTSIEVEASTRALLERFDQLEDIHSCMQNLPWPALIAGIESYGNADRMAFTERLYEKIARDMGFKHYLEVLHFLQVLWSREDADWVMLANQYRLQGRGIVAV